MISNTLIAAATAAATILTLASAAQAETVNIPVPKATVGIAFNAALSSTKVHLHNFGPKDGTSWHKDASYVLLPGGGKKAFPIPEFPYNVTKWRKLKYYVNDMNTSSLQANVNGGRVVLDGHFESQGEEIQGQCVRRRLGKWGECTLDIERDINLNNAIASMSVTPVAYKGSISFADPSVDFKTDVQIANKLCQAFSGICGWIEGKIKNELTKQVEKQIAAQLKSSAVKDAVAHTVKNAPGFRELVDPSWTITKIVSQGNNFIVTVERPDQIGASSVQSLSLKPVQASITSACPATVKLEATIKMKHAVKGTGFLTYENSHKSGTFNWNAGKGQTVTSTVSRSFEGQPGATKNGSAVMRVQWKGSDGKTYSEDSNKATFSVTCMRRPLAASR